MEVGGGFYNGAFLGRGIRRDQQTDHDEQVEIAETIRVVEDRIGSLVNTRNCLQTLFRTLLDQLMTAEIRVNDLDLEELGIEGDEQQAKAV